jgi:hypothetical protein
MKEAPELSSCFLQELNHSIALSKAPTLETLMKEAPAPEEELKHAI